MIYRAALPIDVSSTDYTLTRANTAIYVGAGGNLIVDMAVPTPIIQSAQAVITSVDPSTGAITDVQLLFGGAGYASAPTIVIDAPYGGSGAVLTATITSHVVTSIAISSAGSGYNVTPAGGLGNFNPVFPTLSFSGGVGTGTTFIAVPTGAVLPISVRKVYHASTTAGSLVLLYESMGSTVLGF